MKSLHLVIAKFSPQPVNLANKVKQQSQFD